MDAVHIRTAGMHCDKCPRKIEDALASVEGIVASRAVRSLDVTSVLYEPRSVDPDTIARAIRSQGFDAEVVSGAPRTPRACTLETAA